jgi:pimeloyl-ACP methyl ester carboxylesterase
MLSIWLTHAIVLVLGAPAPPAQAAAPPTDYADIGPHEVASVRVEWIDAARKRPVPAKIYYPADGEGPFAIVIFSHGLGGSREGYAYLGRHWASHGYVSVHLEHEGSDAAVWRGQAKAAEEMQRAAKDPLNSINRPKDVSFAIDQLARMQAEDGGPLAEMLALERVAIAGHSFGAYTALAVAGEAGTHVSDTRSLADERVRAAIPMSTPVPVLQVEYDKVYGPIAIPCLHMTGTLDETPVAFTKADDRRIPYDHITKADQFLITFAGGDHAIFSGRVRRGRYAERDALFQKLILMSTTAFLDAYLNENPEAGTWLREGGLKAALAANARLEFKQPTTQPAESGATSSRTGQPVRSRAPARRGR